jgi:NAD-dependent deacetylase
MSTRVRIDEPLPPSLRNALTSAGHVAVLTGAGVSAESGIPTFREAQTGMWARFDPMKLASPEGFEQDPATVWDWYRWRRELIDRSEPNPGHRALAAMEAHFDRWSLITQNVDGFHRRAGSGHPLELHGNIHRNICSRTGRRIDDDWMARHHDERPPPSPHHPEGFARPDVVWFGEALDETVLETAFAAASECDVMISAGTSAAVQPAATIPLMAAESGAVLIDINPEENAISRRADWHLADGSARWLPRLLEAVTAGER